MIKVNCFYQDNNIVKLEVTGHANFDVHGKDIVCAGVSAIMIGALNACDHLIAQGEVKLEQSSNKIMITVVQPTTTNQTILKTILWQLKTINAKYSKNVVVKEVY